MKHIKISTLEKLNGLSIPIIVFVTSIFSVLSYIHQVSIGNPIEPIGYLLGDFIYLTVSMMAWYKRNYVVAVVTILFKLLFSEGNQFVRMLLIDFNLSWKTHEPYFYFWAFFMTFYLTILLALNMRKFRHNISFMPYSKFTNLVVTFLFVTVFKGPEVAVYTIIPAFVALLYMYKLMPGLLFLSIFIDIPFKMISHMMDETLTVSIFDALYWTIGIIMLVYAFLVIFRYFENLIIKQKEQQNNNTQNENDDIMELI